MEWLRAQGDGPLGLVGMSMASFSEKSILISVPFFFAGRLHRVLLGVERSFSRCTDSVPLVDERGAYLLHRHSLEGDHMEHARGGAEISAFSRRDLTHKKLRLARSAGGVAAIRGRVRGGQKLHVESLLAAPAQNKTHSRWILMEQFTNLRHYPVPLEPRLGKRESDTDRERSRLIAVKFVIAERDAYIEREGAPHIDEIWPGAQVLSLPAVGHVLGFVKHAQSFRQVVVEMMDKAAQLEDERRQGVLTSSREEAEKMTTNTIDATR